MPSAGMTTEDCVKVLTAAGIPSELTEQTRQLFAVCDDARFAQKRLTVGEMKRVRIQLGELIQSLEQQA